MNSDISTECQYRWYDIHRYFTVSETALNKKNQPCVFCGGKDRMRYTDHEGCGSFICNHCMPPGSHDGLSFLMRYTGMGFRDLAMEISKMLGGTSSQPEDTHAKHLKAKKSIKRILKECKALSKGDPVHQYLLYRGLSGIRFSELENIYHCPKLPYWEDGKIISTHPAMIAIVSTPTGENATLHCTYLTDDGRKADVPFVRKTKPPAIDYKGGAVRLMQPKEGQGICIAEGIETVLSIYKSNPDFVPWSVLNDGNMEAFCPPTKTMIMIGGDNDGSFAGQAAAFTLARRLVKYQPVTVDISKTGDFNSDSISIESNENKNAYSDGRKK